ncbi:hypothetical protein ACFWPH_28690 [Nocardia sp. NPDC058499]|uniref:hypothetical protein n=1 Tax=Nocardia sp. NPDC058499 TaxID=3346530 RepID=UPI00365F243A
MTDNHSDDRPPYRFVDHRNVGWVIQAGTGTYRGFDPTASWERPPEVATLAEITDAYGPLRTVQPCRAEEADEFQAALALAGRKAVASLASAAEVIHFEARNRFGPWDADVSATADYATRTLVAGRPGSWESALMSELWLFGSELNLWPRTDSGDVASMRATGPNPKRVHVEARDRMAAVLRAWTASEDRYTEVAETLASLVADYADEHHGPGGWRAIADQWLQPDARLPSAYAEPCHRLLYSRTRFPDDPALG